MFEVTEANRTVKCLEIKAYDYTEDILKKPLPFSRNHRISK